MRENPDNSSNTKNTEGGTVRFHYSRTGRVSKLKRSSARLDPDRILKKRKRRIRFIIIGADLLFILILFYFLSSPTKVSLEKRVGDLICEMNVAGMSGDRLLVGFSVRNSTDYDLRVDPDTQVILRMVLGDDVVTRERKLGVDVLPPSEITTVVFLFDRTELPYSGTVELYYAASPEPLFSKRIRM